MFRSVKKRCWFSAFLLLCALPFFFEKSVEQKIAQIPREDRDAIDTFFRILMLKSAGAYTLFGDKPMTFESYFEEAKERGSFYYHRSALENRQLRRGWEVWQKYQHLFPSKTFLLQARPLPPSQVEILLIHRSHWKTVVEQNRLDFSSVLHKPVTPQRLLDAYESGDRSLFEILGEHEALLGILLGFGNRNAWLYQKNDRLREDMVPCPLKALPLPSSGFATVDEERSYYQNTLCGAFTRLNERKCFKFIYLPGFIGDPRSEETIELRKKYLEQRKKIHAIYCQGNFLEITLKRFSETFSGE